MMIPIVMDTDFTRLGILDDYISFIWSTRYYTDGDFELTLAVNDQTMDLIRRDRYILRDDDDQVGIIERVFLSQNEEGIQTMTVSGRFVTSIIRRRIIGQQTQVSGQVPDCMEQILNDNLISPEDPNRQIPNFIFRNLVTRRIPMQRQYTGKNLGDILSNECETYGLGFRGTIENGSFVFAMYEGTDRSRGQTENTYVIFSTDYDNLNASEYEESQEDLVTDVLVAGEGEGLDRKTIWASLTTNAGLNRHESFKDARNQSTNDGQIDEEEYFNGLRDEGLEDITTYQAALAGTVWFDNYRWKEDVNIGDIVTIANPSWGIEKNTRIVEVIESMSEAGEYTITPTFGA